MDTITHGIAGALLAKAAFQGEDVFAFKRINKGRVITWSVLLGSIFPDSDVIREFFSNDPMLIVTWHRSITHSLVCIPLWVLLLAGLTRWICRWRNWNCPSFVSLCGLWTIGILSHILLDLVTTFGTMIWSPLAWSRPAWDILFIVDFSFTGILVIPQLLAWTYEDPKHLRRRSLLMLLICTPAPFVVSRIAANVGAPTSDNAIVVATILIATLFLVPAMRGWGLLVPHRLWNRVGLTLAVAYIFAAAFAHHQALLRTQRFAASQNLEAKSIAALPYPPSLWHWDGLVLAPRGVYELRLDLSDALFSSSSPIEHSYYPDAPDNQYIEQVRSLPNVRKFLGFARFPVTRFHKEGSESVVEIVDVRFPQIRRDHAPSFKYQVRFSAAGEVLTQGWAK